MHFQLPDDVQQMQRTLRRFMDERILPRNNDFERIAATGRFPLEIVEPLKAEARAAGLWNMFLPGLREDEPGTRMSNMQYAPLAEIIGRLHWASEVFNSNAPDTGNMELLHLWASPEQKQRWLVPLLDGTIRSCFAMTEPDVASSDATNIATTIRRDGGDYVINGRKWFTTGALHPNCKLCIVMGVTDDDPSAAKHRRHSMVLVPMDAPGLKIVRNVPIMHHHAPEGHCEVTFTDVRVPVENLLGEENAGFALAQARLGPGRVHHCMRTIGQCELAMELMCDRALTRRAFGKNLSDFANVQDWIAYSRVEIDQARLYVLQAAWKMDTYGNKSSHIDVSAIKLVAAQLQTRVLDRAMQVFGAMGVTPDTPLSFLWSWGRAMRFFDGPDEVHLRTIARTELAAAKEKLGSTAAYYRTA
ncbi:acyl-CoA dehydrogenase family protein [Pseudorhodoferax sp. LjRoot39]|uniref:acyl-CoA dehydrogenase family protein n=1 Tax=Pseudorhodoferax sp. LjRoot39 TaxID=3342328 RepID=UPI003ECD5EFB